MGKLELDTNDLGDLCRHSGHVVRPGYAKHHRRIDKPRELAATIRAGRYAWPGGYELFFCTNDSAALCFGCVHKNYRLCADAIRTRSNDGWEVTAVMLDAEIGGDETRCDHCGYVINEEGE